MSIRRLAISTKLSALFIAAAFVLSGLAGCGGGGGSGGSSSAAPASAVADGSPPTVSSTSPSSGATAIALNSAVTATFAEAIAPSTATTSSFKLAKVVGGAAVSGTVAVWGSSATFIPSASLAGSTQYRATISNTVTDLSGNPMSASYTWTFTTGAAPDTTPPTVSSVSPSNAANGVATNSTVSATFSEAMTNSTLTTSTFSVSPTTGGGTIAGTVSVSGNTARFTPSAALAPSTQYTAVVASSVTDAAGNALGANFTWRFTTAAAPDTTPPTVTTTSPTNGATGVAPNTSVSATFSEPMTNSTLTTSTVKLATAGGAAVAGAVNVNGNTVTFTPLADLTGSTQYTATITTGAKDAAGNALAATRTWSFTTGAVADTTAPTTPANLNATAVSSSQINLTWSASTDNVAVTGYRVYRGGTLLVTLGNVTSYQNNTGLSGSTTYSYTVQAIDAAGNASAQSAADTATTLATADTTAPSVPGGVTATTLSGSQISLNWTASTDNVAVTGYRIYRGGTLIVTVGTVTTYTDTGLTAGTSYTYAIVAIDAANNASAQSASASATTTAAPSNNGTANLAWNAVTASNLAGYRVYYGTSSGNYIQAFGQGIDVGNVLAYTVTGLTSGVTYYFAVTAYDTSGNESTYSSEVSKTIP
jgi:hypothetical protein